MTAPQVVRAGTELRVSPPGDPLGSCAFAWPEGWGLTAYEWAPPGLHEAASLLSLTDGEAALQLHVARFGCEVDGLEFLRGWCPGEWRDLEWEGLDIAGGGLGEAAWRVVHTGPALHLLEAVGAARDHLDGAARTLRSLTDAGPNAEPLTRYTLGPLSTLRLASWTVAETVPEPHGHHRERLELRDPKGDALARIDVHVVDRRIHVGYDPGGLRGELPGEAVPDVAASGGVETWVEGAVERRRGIRQLGAALVCAVGTWPARTAPVARLNARRHLDILLSG